MPFYNFNIRSSIGSSQKMSLENKYNVNLLRKLLVLLYFIYIKTDKHYRKTPHLDPLPPPQKKVLSEHLLNSKHTRSNCGYGFKMLVKEIHFSVFGLFHDLTFTSFPYVHRSQLSLGDDIVAKELVPNRTGLLAG